MAVTRWWRALRTVWSTFAERPSNQLSHVEAGWDRMSIHVRYYAEYKTQPCSWSGAAGRGGPRPTAASGTQKPVQSQAAVGACAPRKVPLRPGAGPLGRGRHVKDGPCPACAASQSINQCAHQTASNRGRGVCRPAPLANHRRGDGTVYYLFSPRPPACRPAPRVHATSASAITAWIISQAMLVEGRWCAPPGSLLMASPNDANRPFPFTPPHPLCIHG